MRSAEKGHRKNRERYEEGQDVQVGLTRLSHNAEFGFAQFKEKGERTKIRMSVPLLAFTFFPPDIFSGTIPAIRL